MFVTAKNLTKNTDHEQYENQEAEIVKMSRTDGNQVFPVLEVKFKDGKILHLHKNNYDMIPEIEEAFKKIKTNRSSSPMPSALRRILRNSARSAT